MKKIILALILSFSLTGCTESPEPPATKTKKAEKHYQADWCAEKGKTEHVLPDRTRVDCLTPRHAIEFDWGKKWHEAIGQSLYYALQTGKRAGVVLIITDKKHRRFWIRLNSTIEHHRLPIDTWLIEDY